MSPDLKRGHGGVNVPRGHAGTRRSQLPAREVGGCWQRARETPVTSPATRGRFDRGHLSKPSYYKLLERKHVIVLLELVLCC